MHGSEGGESGSTGLPYPYPASRLLFCHKGIVQRALSADLVSAQAEGLADEFATVAQPANDAALEFAGLRQNPAVGAHDRA
jgi:hypothetical protein